MKNYILLQKLENDNQKGCQHKIVVLYSSNFCHMYCNIAYLKEKSLGFGDYNYCSHGIAICNAPRSHIINIRQEGQHFVFIPFLVTLLLSYTASCMPSVGTMAAFLLMYFAFLLSYYILMPSNKYTALLVLDFRIHGHRVHSSWHNTLFSFLHYILLECVMSSKFICHHKRNFSFYFPGTETLCTSFSILQNFFSVF